MESTVLKVGCFQSANKKKRQNSWESFVLSQPMNLFCLLMSFAAYCKCGVQRSKYKLFISQYMSKIITLTTINLVTVYIRGHSDCIYINTYYKYKFMYTWNLALELCHKQHLHNA